MGADVCRTSSRGSRRPPDVISTAAILNPRWRRRKWRHPGPGAGFSIPVVEGGGKWRPYRFRSPSWVTSFAGTGNEVIQDGDRKRKGRHFPPPSTMGIEKPALYYLWPLNLVDDPVKQKCTSSMLIQALCIIAKSWVNSNLSYSPEISNLRQNRWVLVLCDLEISHMTVKNIRASVLCYLTLCAAFHSPHCIQTGAIVWKRSIRVKIGKFLSRVTLKIDGWPRKKLGTFSMLHEALCISS